MFINYVDTYKHIRFILDFKLIHTYKYKIIIKNDNEKVC
jgi:hypothetical protein